MVSLFSKNNLQVHVRSIGIQKSFYDTMDCVTQKGSRHLTCYPWPLTFNRWFKVGISTIDIQRTNRQRRQNLWWLMTNRTWYYTMTYFKYPKPTNLFNFFSTRAILSEFIELMTPDVVHFLWLLSKRKTYFWSSEDNHTDVALVCFSVVQDAAIRAKHYTISAAARQF